MIATIRVSIVSSATAEEEIRECRIANRPSAGLPAQLEQCSPLRHRDSRIQGRILDIGAGGNDPRRVAGLLTIAVMLPGAQPIGNGVEGNGANGRAS